MTDCPTIELTERDNEVVRFAFDACRFFGASLVTAHRVATLIAEEVERIARFRETTDD